MKTIEVITQPKVEETFDAYPDFVRGKMQYLRELVLETANEMEDVLQIEETLKWGEPSFITKKGSTLRIDWKPKSPDQYAMYFKCTSRLVETFREQFGDTFQYEDNRAILFQLDQEIPQEALKKCIKATLSYHKARRSITSH